MNTGSNKHNTSDWHLYPYPEPGEDPPLQDQVYYPESGVVFPYNVDYSDLIQFNVTLDDDNLWGEDLEKMAPPPGDTYNMSMIPYPGNRTEMSILAASMKVGFCIVIMAIALLGNMAVIITVWKKKRLRTTTNYYIVNLAVSDLLVTVSCTWVQVASSLTDGWQLGAFFCYFNSFAQVLSLVSSILTLTLIACDRFFGIMFAMRAHLVERRAYVFIVLVWILSIGVSMPLIFYRSAYTRYWSDHVEIWCGDDWPFTQKIIPFVPGFNRTVISFPIRKTYYTLVSLVLFFIPIAIMSVAYLLIIYKLWSRMPPGEVLSSEVSAQVRVKRKVILMLMTILSVFAVCWLPLQISILYSEYRPNDLELPDWYEEFKYFASFLANSNSAINPIIYTCFNENYRKAFREVFGCGSRRHPHINGHRYSYSCYNTLEMRTSHVDRNATEVITARLTTSSSFCKKTANDKGGICLVNMAR